MWSSGGSATRWRRPTPPPSPAAPAVYRWVVPPLGTPHRGALEALFTTLPEHPRIVLETASVAMIAAMRAASDCLSLNALAQIETEFASSGLAIVRTAMTPRATRPMGVTTRSDWLSTRVQKLFLDAFLALTPAGCGGGTAGPHDSLRVHRVQKRASCPI